jgi:prepilin-type N-terminal cleavage/methylation domain-containing protein
MMEKKNILNNETGRCGFTLVETLVTIAILSIVSLVSFAIYQRGNTGYRVSRIKIEMSQNMRSAADIITRDFQNSLGSFPFPACSLIGLNDDGLDNDNDGLSGEEIPNGVDDDVDGLVDEDIGEYFAYYAVLYDDNGTMLNDVKIAYWLDPSDNRLKRSFEPSALDTDLFNILKDDFKPFAGLVAEANFEYMTGDAWYDGDGNNDYSSAFDSIITDVNGNRRYDGSIDATLDGTIPSSGSVLLDSYPTWESAADYYYPTGSADFLPAGIKIEITMQDEGKIVPETVFMTIVGNQ